MKKAISVISLFLFIFIVNHQLVNAQDFFNLALKSKISKNGLEVSNYKKVRIKIVREGSDVEKVGLIEERIRTKIELRLRQAGLEPLASAVVKKGADILDEYLSIIIQVLPIVFSVRIQFDRVVLIEANGNTYFHYGPAWIHSGAGSHSGESKFIIESLDLCLDTFLNEYLKANVK